MASMISKTSSPSKNIIQRLEDQIPELMERSSIVGLSIALIDDARVTWKRGFGFKSKESNELITVDTIFEAGSLSKPVFSYAVLKLCEAGVLSLDTPLTSYLPEPYLPNEPLLEHVTTRHVLSHTTGFPNWCPEGQSLRIHFMPGERFSYSGEGYVYLQKVIEHLTGQLLGEYLWSTLLEPLGMYNSSYVWLDQYNHQASQGYATVGEVVEMDKSSEANSAYSLRTNPSEYARFIIAIMHSQEDDQFHLSRETISEMMTPHTHVNDSASWHSGWPESAIEINEQVSWGLGWGIQHVDGEDAIWHWGENGAHQSFAIFFMKDKFGVVSMLNTRKSLGIWDDLLRIAIGGEQPAISWLKNILSHSRFN